MRRRITSLSMLAASVVALCASCSRSALHVPPQEAGMDAGVDAMVEEPILCLEVPPDGTPIRAALTIPVELSMVDLFFLIDASGSMRDEIGNVRSRLQGFVVPRVRASIGQAAFGLAFFGEFPVSPHGDLGHPEPYEMRVPITTDPLAIAGGLELVPDWSNADYAEAQVEGLFQVATGAGLPPFIEPSFGCSSGGEGGGCFRRDALPVIMLITDAPFHNGPPGIAPNEPYTFTPAPHSYQDALDALRDKGILVMGLGASDTLGPSPLPHLTAIARDTGALDHEGRALAFSIGDTGNGLGEAIVQAIEQLAEGLPLDVDAVADDNVDDGFDATELITAITPLEADPSDGVSAITANSFIGTRPGTQVTFEIAVNVSSLPPSPMTRRIPATIIFRAARRSVIGEKDVIILVPGTDGDTCDAGVASAFSMAR